MPASTLERPQLLAGLGVQGDELTGRRALEHQPACRGQCRGAHRVLVAPAPLLLAGERVDSAHEPVEVVEVHGNTGAPVRDALLELAAPAGGRPPDFLHRYVDQTRLLAVGHVGPFLTPS